MTARYVGLDLSLAETGIADVHGAVHTVTTSPKAALEYRLDRIANVCSYQTSDADVTAIEGYVTRSPAASVLGTVHGAVRLALWRAGRAFVIVSPGSLKKYATGKGNATKADMRMSLYQRTGVDDANDNRVDAAWLRYMLADAMGDAEVTMPAGHRAALTGVEWPT